MSQYAFDLLASQSVGKIAVNVHHLASEARQGIERLERGSSTLLFSDETDVLMGSAGGMARASRLLGGVPFFVLNADRVADVDLHALGSRHLSLRRAHGVSVTLLFRRGGKGTRYRDFTLDGSGELAIGGGELKEEALHYAGAAVMEPEAFGGLPLDRESDFYADILVPLMRRRRVGVLVADGLWFDIDSPLLWMEAHFELMRAMEGEGLVPGWKRRISCLNHRLAEGQWALRAAPAESETATHWKGPCYWGRADAPPGELGPRAVVYPGVGAPPGGFAHGIGLAGSWVTAGPAILRPR